MKRWPYLALLLLLLPVADSVRAAHIDTSLYQQQAQDHSYEVLSGKHAVTGDQRILVILVEFSDVNHTRSADAIRKLAIDELNAYYNEVSYGQVSITGDVYGWYRLERPMAYYGGDGTLTGGDDNVQRLAQDAVDFLPPSVDISSFKFLVVVHAGGNQAVDSPGQASDEIWSRCFCAVFPHYLILKPVTAGSKSFENYSFMSEHDGPGSYTHETGHLFGLPDLYDTRAGRSYVGYWSLMDFGVYCCGTGAAYSPPYIGGWGAALLGWLKPIVPEPTGAVWSSALQPVESPDVTTVLIPISQATYYFIEYRAKIGRDSNLPNSGIVVYYVDERLDTGYGILKVVDPDTGLPLKSLPNPGSLSGAVFQSGDMLLDAAHSVHLSMFGREPPTILYSSADLTGIVLRTNLATSTESLILHYGDTIPLRVTLSDELGRALSGQNVTLEIMNQTAHWRTMSYTATDQSGQISLDLDLKEDIGPYVLRLTYTGGRVGDHWYLESAHDVPLMIMKGKVTLSLSTPFLMLGDRLTAEITASGQQGQTLTDVPLHVSLDGEWVSLLTTDSTGKATLDLQIATGAHNITVTNTSPNYEESSTSKTVNAVPVQPVAAGVVTSVAILAAAIIILRSRRRASGSG